MLKKHLFENLEILALEGNDIYSFKDGSLGACFELTPIEATFLEDDEINSLGQRIKNIPG